MRRRNFNRTLIALVLCAGTAFADDPYEPEPDWPPPQAPATTTYDTALNTLEQTVDGYFHAVLRTEVGATNGQLSDFEAALSDKILGQFSTDDLNYLTPREQIIQIKMIVLRQLHADFSNDRLPADLAAAFDAWEAARPDATAMLFERGEL